MIENYVPPSEFNLVKIAVGQQIKIPLVSNIDASAAREVSVLVRMMAANFAGTGAAPTLAFELYAVAPCGDGKIYLVPTPVVIASFGAQTAPTAPSVAMGSNISGSTVTPVGGLVSLWLNYTQYVTTVTSATFTVSVDLVQKR